MLQMILGGEWDPIALVRFSVRVNDKVASVTALNDVLFCQEVPAAVSDDLFRIDGTAPALRIFGISERRRTG